MEIVLQQYLHILFVFKQRIVSEYLLQLIVFVAMMVVFDFKMRVRK